ncbi:MAG: S24/S26 family peptidase [Lachnospiraceae bacterium]|nr:S24/S26 family peptidase [Lachnospiraceae bacterium]
MVEKQSPEEVLAQNNSVQFSTTGFSMYPLLNPGKMDQVIVEPLGERRLRRGDVVLYRRNGEVGKTDAEGFAEGILVLHRIHHIKGDEFYMVGDNQTQIEGPLGRDQLRGVMTYRVRKGKRLSVKNVLYRTSTGLWLTVRPLRPKIMRMAEIVKNLIVRKK